MAAPPRPTVRATRIHVRRSPPSRSRCVGCRRSSPVMSMCNEAHDAWCCRRSAVATHVATFMCRNSSSQKASGTLHTGRSKQPLKQYFPARNPPLSALSVSLSVPSSVMVASSRFVLVRLDRRNPRILCESDAMNRGQTMSRHHDVRATRARRRACDAPPSCGEGTQSSRRASAGTSSSPPRGPSSPPTAWVCVCVCAIKRRDEG